ncbi:MAG: hypothetical protein BM485_00890 [Desulfobulbaceae bacterium DB1]|nr:MAG: hypothetical protein BM485_00890 [Desulfobulbaceae bacterium DB1]
MENKLQSLIEKIKELENELSRDIQKKEEEFFYTIRGKKVRFDREIKSRHQRLAKRLRHFLKDAPFLHFLTVPVIWFCLFPALFLDAVVSIYQFACFPVYGIPKVKRGRYIVIDRHSLSYLNIVEKVNCVYCGYFNGLIGYVREVAGRTEQYWCPIKHARRTSSFHSRSSKFLEYGDADGYRKNIEKIRRDFQDLT